MRVCKYQRTAWIRVQPSLDVESLDEFDPLGADLRMVDIEVGRLLD